jgi:aminoglycoside phosphotransferase (APT) family kinase protein
LLQATHPHFPLAPQALLLVEDPKLIGAPFYVMERRRGLVIRKRDSTRKSVKILELRRRISESLVDSLVALHEGGDRAAQV